MIRTVRVLKALALAGSTILPTAALSQGLPPGPGNEFETPGLDGSRRIVEGGAAAVSGLTFSEEISDVRRSGAGIGTASGLGFTTRNLVTQGAASDTGFSAFASLSFTDIQGDFSGSATKFVAGIDRSFSDGATIGLLVIHDDSTTDPQIFTPFEIDRQETLIGPYASTPLNDVFSVDSFFAVGTADYDIEGVEFSTDKWIAGATLSAVVPNGDGELIPFIGVSAINEELPSYTVGPLGYSSSTMQTQILTIGTDAYYAPIDTARALILPFSSIELDFAKTRSSNLFDDSYTAVRVGGGAVFGFDAGALELKAEYSSSSDDYDTLSASAFFGLQF